MLGRVFYQERRLPHVECYHVRKFKKKTTTKNSTKTSAKISKKDLGKLRSFTDLRWSQKLKEQAQFIRHRSGEAGKNHICD